MATFWLRLRNRLRFGLVIQELLDRVARIGVVIYPYVIIYEPILRRPQADILPDGLRVRQLEPREASLVKRCYEPAIGNQSSGAMSEERGGIRGCE